MQKVILDLLPGGVAPIVYASQYDDGRSIRFMLTEGGPDNQYSLNSSDVITCNLTKPDGTETVINVANPGAGKTYVDLVNGADDYDQAGAYLGEIVLTKDAKVIGSANFVLKVEEDAYGGQITTLSATGNPCTFSTDLADALVSLTADIVCGGGGGTPSTPIPLVGHSEMNLVRCGVNLCNTTLTSTSRYDVDFTVNADKSITANGTASGTFILNITDQSTLREMGIMAGVDYFLNGCPAGGSESTYRIQFSVSGSGTEPKDYGNGVVCNFSESDLDKTYQIIFYINSGTQLNNLVFYPQLVIGSTALPYAPYDGQTFTVAFGQTVYGGVLDVTRGKLSVMWAGTKIKDLGWYYDDGFQRFYSTDQVDIKHPASDNDTPFILCDIYNTVAFSYFNGADRPNNSISNPIANGRINIRDTRFTDTALFIASVGEYYIAYELDTPIVIDVTAISVFAENGTNNITSDCLGDVNVTYIKKV